MADYDKPAELYAGLRLHQNENTAGCSRKVLEALAGLSPQDVAFYPPYSAAIDAVASHLGVPATQVALTNGLDEGIMAVAIAYLRPRAGAAAVPEAIVPLPAFEIFAFNASVVGAHTVPVMPRPDFAFAIDEVLAAITPRTGVVFITNPNNPTGVATTIDDIRRVAAALPPGAVVFVDEAYVDFGGRTFIPEIAAAPNVIVGRTFAKAYGLAGLRVGAVVGAEATLEPVRRAIGVYSVNAAAVVAVQAALLDTDHVHDYLRQVRESKALTYALCERLGLEYWPSDANFVLIRTGGATPALVAEAAARGIYLRDRSNEPGCAGCIRLTTGIVEHTRRGLAVIEEVLCAAR